MINHKMNLILGIMIIGVLMVIGSFDIAYAHETNCPDNDINDPCYNSDNPETNEIIHNLIDLGMENVVDGLASISSDSFSYILYNIPSELRTITPLFNVVTQSDFDNAGCVRNISCDLDIIYGVIFNPSTIDKLSFENKQNIWYKLHGESTSVRFFDETFTKIPLEILEEIYDTIVPHIEPPIEDEDIIICAPTSEVISLNGDITHTLSLGDTWENPGITILEKGHEILNETPLQIIYQFSITDETIDHDSFYVVDHVYWSGSDDIFFDAPGNVIVDKPGLNSITYVLDTDTKCDYMALRDVIILDIQPTIPIIDDDIDLQELIESQNDIIAQQQIDIDNYKLFITSLQISKAEMQHEYEVIKAILEDVFKLISDYQ